MCEFHESTCNGFGDIWWTDNPIYFSSIDDLDPYSMTSGVSHLLHYIIANSMTSGVSHLLHYIIANSMTSGVSHLLHYIIANSNTSGVSHLLHYIIANSMTSGVSHLLHYITRGGPCQHGFMCGCMQWSNNINESN